MPNREIKELRQSGKVEEALELAKAELKADPANIWTKRNISWVYYEYLKLNCLVDQFDTFVFWLTEINKLDLPEDEKMLFDHCSWQIGKMVFGLMKNSPIEPLKGIRLFEVIRTFHFPKPSEGYSYLFKSFHKLLRESDKYILFADWWNFKNFMPMDFEKERMSNGKEMMSIAEQAYIIYSKHLLPKQTEYGATVFDRVKASEFVPALSVVVDNYPNFQYPAYFLAKLLVALGDKDNLLDTLLPFAKKKQNEFWVWEILAEAFPKEPEKVLACYCKALSCNSKEEMLVSLRQKMAGILISRKLYPEAKTEIELLIHSRTEQGNRIPNEVLNWQIQEWYKNAIPNKSNIGFYKNFVPTAEGILFSDIPEETVIVEFVNSDRKILNFIASDAKWGFFKYDRFFRDVKVGKILKVRFKGGSHEGLYQLYTAICADDEVFKKQFMKQVSGIVKIPYGKSFGFLGDVFIHPKMVTRLKLVNGMPFSGFAMKSYNQEKNQWGWKLLQDLK